MSSALLPQRSFKKLCLAANSINNCHAKYASWLRRLQAGGKY